MVQGNASRHPWARDCRGCRYPSPLDSLKLRKGDKAEADARGRIDRCIKPALGNRHLDTLRTADIEEWLHGLIPAGLGEEETRRAKDSANRNMTALKAPPQSRTAHGMAG